MILFKNLKVSVKILAIIMVMLCFQLIVAGVGYYFNNKAASDMS